MGLHINPLKLKKVMVLNEGSGTEVEKDEPMSWEDAAKVSLVIMLSQVFIVFLPKWAADVIQADIVKFCFELLVFAGSSFFASFLALAGLTYVYKPPKKDS